MAKRNLVLFDDRAWGGLRPLTWLRPVADLRFGILKVSERWEALLTGEASTVTQPHLSSLFPLTVARDNFFINAALLPTPQLRAAILKLGVGEALVADDELLVARLDADAIGTLATSEAEGTELDGLRASSYAGEIRLLRRPYDVFGINREAITEDFKLLTESRHSESVPSSNTTLGDAGIFLERGSSVEACILDARDGPIYLGANSTVLPGSVLKGPVAVCKNGVVKMGAKLYPGTTIGQGCKVGGEVNNVVFQDNSNKAHDGYLGNAVVGEFCNLGADTNASNLKNNYAEIRLWDYEAESFTPSGLQFCGLILGDHAKCGINTMFNTGTVVGMGANVFGSGFPRTFIPDFAWGGAAGMSTYKLEKFFKTAERVFARKGLVLSQNLKDAMQHVFEETQALRSWERTTVQTQA